MEKRLRSNNWRHGTNKLKVFLLLFLVLFLLRLAYGYYTTPNEVQRRSARTSVPINVEEAFSSVKKNYASDRYLLKNAPSAPSSGISLPPAAALDQKYEKTATVMTASAKFDEDEAAVRATIDEFGAIVQYEQSKGQPDSRSRVLQLMIGVQPQQFDDFCRKIEAIGKLESIEITKSDKTNEFLDLKAQRASLEATREALNELKRMQGNIDEFVNLQYKILDIDRQLQALGVRLGDYDEINEFCTVRLTMYEDYEIIVNPPALVRRLMVAFTWTVKYYLALLTAFAFFSMIVFFLGAIGEQTKRLSAPYAVRGEKPGMNDFKEE